MPEPISLTSVGIGLGGFTILTDVNVSAGRGEVIGVTGANGSGKTTLIRMMATLASPREGTGSVLGAELGTDQVYDVRRRIGLISHLPAIIGELTLEDHLRHVIRLAGQDVGRIPAALRAVGLEGAGGRLGYASSFGMLRRTEVARLLIAEPEILLLDEAFSGLDAEASSLIDALMARTIGRGGAAVVVSHDRSHMQSASRVFSIVGGTVQAAS